jgi:tagatose 6-phosphate kinase
VATILTVTANPLLDHLADADAVPGMARRIERFQVVAGGKGINAGRVLASHGHRVIATGFAGGASGDQLATLIAGDGMEPRFVRTAARLRIGFMCSPAGGRPTQVMENGFAVSGEEVGALVAQVRRALGGCSLCLVGGSIPDESCLQLFRQIAAACSQAGVPCWIDSYGKAMDEVLGSATPPDLVKPNREEYGAEGKRWLPAREIHLTDGGAEIRVWHREGRWRVTPPRVDCRNAVGSGDCYLAGLAHARLSGMPLIDQLRYAAAAGAANAAAGSVARIAPGDIATLVGAVSVRTASD